MNSSTNSWRIEDLRDRFLKINMSPNYQRESNLWTSRQKQKLIDSVLNGFDIPKFYVTRLDDGPFDWAVADGKQRISVLMEFMQPKGQKSLGSFAFADPGFALAKDFVPDRESRFFRAVLDQGSEQDFPKPNSTFENFTKVAQRAFLGCKLDFVEIQLHNYEEEQGKILELYERLNDGKALTNVEKRYALPGAMNSYLQQLSRERKFFTTQLKIQNKRYQHYDMANRLALMAEASYGGGEGILDLKPAALKNFIVTYAAEAQFQTVKPAIESLLKKLENTFQHDDALLSAPGSIAGYAAFVIRAEREYASPHGIWGSIRNCLQKVYVERPHSLSQHEPGSPESEKAKLLRRYSDALGESTTSARSIRKQAAALMEMLPIYSPEVVSKDENRGFTTEQRLAIWLKSEYKCMACNKRLKDMSEMHADHVVPHSKGGATSVENGQSLCEDCNLRKSNRT